MWLCYEDVIAQIHSTHPQYASIASFHTKKKHSLAETVSTSAKLCVPMNTIGGSQTHPQQRSIAHFCRNITLNLSPPFV
uniref:SFRICE_016053 n=1 Tax=Spodoptera frugiperda TaxID=7108 RepID=A0A2H1V4T7_SPOFR